MALVLADRVQETTATTGTGTITLAGAVAGFQSFAAVGNANTCYYTITSGSAWEVGIGTYTSSGTTLSRDTILSSSASGAAISLTGTSTVFVTYPSGRAIYANADSTCNLPGTTTVAGNVSLTGGTSIFSSTYFTTGTTISMNAATTITTGSGLIATFAVNSFILSTTGVGTISIGGTSATGSISIGRSTASQSVVIGSGVTASGNTGTFQIGVNGATGSTTAITIGSTAGTSTTTVNGRTVFTGTYQSQGYTVATLPTAGTAGRRAHVTDALAPTFLGALTGGGAVRTPVFDNGTAWVAG